MARYDVVIIGAGLGGLTAGAILAREGCKVLIIERGNSVGGAASSYKSGDLFIEASLHTTSGPEHPKDAKHRPLTRAGVLDKVEWVPTGALYEVRGGPLDTPLALPASLDGARETLTQRFPSARDGIASILNEIARIANAAAELSTQDNAREQLAQLGSVLPDIDLDISLSERLNKAFGDNEAVKCALAANLWHYHDDPSSLWWPFFAVSQGGYFRSGGRYVKTGSQRLSSSLARAIRGGGGEVLVRRVVTNIGTDASGRANSVMHIAKAGGDPQQVEADCIVTNASPFVSASLLPETEGTKLKDSLAARTPSISLFALTLGVSKPPQDFGLSAYSTQLLPDWMTHLSDYAKGAPLFADEPGERMPPMSIVNYSAIDSGVPSAPWILSIVGPDRLSNWSGVPREVYTAKRARWQEAITSYLDGIYPGLKNAIALSSFNTASSMVSYLNASNGSAYGFAPTSPNGDQSAEQSPRTSIDGLYLASAYTGFGGYNGAIQGGEACADAVLADLKSAR